MSEELKPCPFCGGKAKLMISVEDWVLCTICKASSDTTSDPKRAIEKWNKRA